MKTFLTTITLVVAFGSFAQAQPQEKQKATKSKIEARARATARALKQNSSLTSKARLLLGGGQEGSGGDTVTSPSGGRGLLDLVEREDLTPVLLNPYSYDKDLMGNLMGLFSEYVTSYYISEGILDPSFVYFLYSGFGFEFDLESCQKGSCLIKIRPGIQAKVSSKFEAFLRSTNKYAKRLKWYFSSKPLDEIDDEGIIRLLDSTSKKQVAIQKDGVVFINEREFHTLDDRNKAALIYHELVLYAVVNLNPNLIKEKGTEPVRTYVRRMIKWADGRSGKSEVVPEEWIIEAYKSLGIKN